MIIKGIIFDINGTLSDIWTDEGDDDVYRVISNLLSYQGILLEPALVRQFYFREIEEQLAAGVDRHPEFDALKIFRKMITQHATAFTLALSPTRIDELPLWLAQTYRAASRLRLQRYPGVEETLRQLHRDYHLAIVSDAQTAYALAELHAVGLAAYFDPIIVSGDFGYRKPDERLFTAALNAMNMDPAEVVFVGNDMYRDVYGAQQLKIKTVFFRSNQGTQEMEGVRPDYVIYSFPELLNAVRFFTDR